MVPGNWPASRKVRANGGRPRSAPVGLLGAATIAVGDPALCVQRLTEAIAGTGIRHVLLMVEGAGDPAATVENIMRLGTLVIPRLSADRV